MKRPADWDGLGKDVRGSHAVIEENEPKETRVGSVSRGEDDILN